MFHHRMRWFWVFWGVMAWCVSPNSLAANARVALVIGNADYQFIPRLKNPSNDANALAESLRKKGFEVFSGVNMPKNAMERRLLEFSRAANDADLALVFYAGHGMQANGQNYLLPVDAKLEDELSLRVEAIDLEFVLQTVRNAKTRLVFLDACRDNPLGNRANSAGRTLGTTRGLARVDTAQGGTLVAFSTGPGDIAQDGAGQNSPFTTALLQHLETPGLEIRQVLSRVRVTVQGSTQGKQLPWENSSLLIDIYITPNGTSTPQVSVVTTPTPAALDPNEIIFWNSYGCVMRQKAGCEEYLKKYPKGQFAELARTILAENAALNPPNNGFVPPPRPDGKQPERPSLAKFAPKQRFKDCPVCPDMVMLPRGEFMMGETPNDPQVDNDEKPNHKVKIAYTLAIGTYEVTFEEYDAFAKATNRTLPRDFGWGRGRQPVMNVTWEEANAYAKWISDQTGRRYRLPSEAEWEYAARAGERAMFIVPNQESAFVPNLASCNRCGSRWDGERAAPVGSFPPNKVGVHDLGGNVWEWVQDCYVKNYYDAPTNGNPQESGGNCQERVYRGGAWNSNMRALRTANRNHEKPTYQSNALGFRLVVTE